MLNEEDDCYADKSDNLTGKTMILPTGWHPRTLYICEWIYKNCPKN